MTPLTRRAILAGATALAATGAAAAPRARLLDGRWRRFGTRSDPDHGAWDAILARAVYRGRDGVVRFDYAGTDKAQVDAYVASLSVVDPSTLSAPAAFAYWVNAYNAVTVQTVLAHWPVASIREIGGGILSRGPWKDKRFPVAGTTLSLDDIEHGILRPIWQDPRIHYAVNCASVGCPDLAPRAWNSDRLPAHARCCCARLHRPSPRGRGDATRPRPFLDLRLVPDRFRRFPASRDRSHSGIRRARQGRRHPPQYHHRGLSLRLVDKRLSRETRQGQPPAQPLVSGACGSGLISR